jgi:hypothetical protein
MSSWSNLFQKPSSLKGRDDLDNWFDRIAARLLAGSRLMVGSGPHRFVEVEFYYCGDGHPDPFTHKDPIQLESGRWYFHRTGGMYRSGSFKGIDLTFGHDGVHGGILIRGIEDPDGELIDGPSLCVDYLLSKTGMRDVASLDDAIGGRVAWDSNNPLFLDEASEEGRPLLKTARVGLSLKKARGSELMNRYIMRRYRYLSEPRRTAKGRAHMILALHADSKTPEEIAQSTGGTKSGIQRYISDYEEGKQEADFSSYIGKDLSPKDLCRLHGTWAAVFAKG